MNGSKYISNNKLMKSIKIIIILKKLKGGKRAVKIFWLSFFS
jgi:hypothetical protein